MGALSYRRIGVFFLFFWSALLCGAAHLLPGNAHAAETRCFSTHVLTTFQGHYRRGEPRVFQSPLLSQRPDGFFVTPAMALLRIDEYGKIQLELQHLANQGDELGLPYQIFAVELKVAGTTHFFRDFTNECREAGLELYPGRIIFAPLPKENEVLPRECESTCPVVLRVWGQL